MVSHNEPPADEARVGKEGTAMRLLVIIGMLVSAFSVSAALAQTTTSTEPKSSTASKSVPKTAVPQNARTAESLECSKQADAKGLHGKERKKFRATCKRQLLAKKT